MSGYPSSRAVAKQAGYDRILVDGVDVTFFRGLAVPAPDYLLTEPFAYGPTVLELPQVNGELDELGVGELSWIREDAPVVVQRVDDPNAATPVVLSTDYRGFVACIDVDGRNLSLEVGGEFSGPASMVQKLQPLVRRVKDVGYWAAGVIETLNLQPTTRSGPVTGIELPEGGGGSLLDWASDVCAWSQTTSGAQRTIMPSSWGGNVWGFGLKDTTTRHLTLFTDDARVVPRLRRDRTAVPTTWYGTGVTPDGVRWRNARYPGVFQGPAPTFPGSMSLGDTDADTSTGDGVTVLNEKLVAMHYLSTNGLDYTTYGASTVAAVKALQDDAGLSETGTTDSATWESLFDVSVTGYSLSDTHIAPLFQVSAVREFNRSSNGSIIGRNPTYDASIKPVERFIDFGPNTTKAQAVEWCRGQYARLSGKNWVGTIELNGFGGFSGNWAPTDAAYLNDPATGVDYIMSQLDIRPGMNAWLPLFDGGTLVHISGVQVSRRDRRVTLTVDTLARDLLELAALNERKSDASRNIRREWYADNRASKQSGNMVTRDEYFGFLDRNIALDGNQWNVFPVIVGQHGQVNRVRLRTTNDQAKFAVAAFSQKMTRKRLNRRVGNPLTTAPESVWEQESLQDWFDDRVLLYAVGDGTQPCGYSPRRHRDDNGDATSAPITGRFLDDASWPYICTSDQPAIIYLAVYPDRDCTLKRGQILWAQLDDAV